MPDEAKTITAVILNDIHASAVEAQTDGPALWTCVLDEFGAVIATAGDHALALLQRGRTHEGQVHVITQSIADIEALTGQTGLLASMADNFTGFIMHRQTAPESRDWLAKLMGTTALWQSTDQTSGHAATGAGSRRRVREFKVSSDTLRRTAPRRSRRPYDAWPATGDLPRQGTRAPRRPPADAHRRRPRDACEMAASATQVRARSATPNAVRRHSRIPPAAIATASASATDATPRRYARRRLAAPPALTPPEHARCLSAPRARRRSQAPAGTPAPSGSGEQSPRHPISHDTSQRRCSRRARPLRSVDMCPQPPGCTRDGQFRTRQRPCSSVSAAGLGRAWRSASTGHRADASVMDQVPPVVPPAAGPVNRLRDHAPEGRAQQGPSQSAGRQGVL